jgi:hypothetical protein
MLELDGGDLQGCSRYCIVLGNVADVDDKKSTAAANLYGLGRWRDLTALYPEDPEGSDSDGSSTGHRFVALARSCRIHISFYLCIRGCP